MDGAHDRLGELKFVADRHEEERQGSAQQVGALLCGGQVAKGTVSTDDVLDLVGPLDLLVVSQYGVGTIEVEEVAGVGDPQLKAVAADEREVVVALHVALDRHHSAFRAEDIQVLERLAGLNDPAERLPEKADELGEVRVDNDGLRDWAIAGPTQLIDKVTKVVEVGLLLIH